MTTKVQGEKDRLRDVIDLGAQKWMNRKRGKYGWVSWLGLAALASLLVLAPASIWSYVLVTVALILVVIGTRLKRRTGGSDTDPKAKTEYRV